MVVIKKQHGAQEGASRGSNFVNPCKQQLWRWETIQLGRVSPRSFGSAVFKQTEKNVPAVKLWRAIVPKLILFLWHSVFDGRNQGDK